MEVYRRTYKSVIPLTEGGLDHQVSLSSLFLRCSENTRPEPFQDTGTEVSQLLYSVTIDSSLQGHFYGVPSSLVRKTSLSFLWSTDHIDLDPSLVIFFFSLLFFSYLPLFLPLFSLTSLLFSLLFFSCLPYLHIQ